MAWFRIGNKLWRLDNYHAIYAEPRSDTRAGYDTWRVVAHNYDTMNVMAEQLTEQQACELMEALERAANGLPGVRDVNEGRA